MEAKKFRQLNEALDWVFEAPKKEQVDRMKSVAKGNQTFIPYVRWGLGADKVEWGLPEGMPESTKIKDDIPDGMGETTLQLEFRRIQQFTNPESNMNNLPDWKREMNWMSILEGVHHKEAELITHIKDGQLLKLYPKLEAILPDLGITDWNKSKKKATRKKVKK